MARGRRTQSRKNLPDAHLFAKHKIPRKIPRPKPKRAGDFLDEVEISERGKRRRVLYVVDPAGRIREYGRITPTSKKKLSSFHYRADDASFKDALADKRIFDRIARKRAKGVEITIRGVGRKGKDAIIRSRIIFRKGRKGKKYLQRLIMGKVMAKLKQREFRLSHGPKAKRNKAFTHLKKQKFRIDYFE